MGVALNTEALDRELVRRGWTSRDLARAAGLCDATICTARSGKRRNFNLWPPSSSVASLPPRAAACGGPRVCVRCRHVEAASTVLANARS